MPIFNENLKPATPQHAKREKQQIYEIFVSKFKLDVKSDFIEQHIMTNTTQINNDAFMIEEIHNGKSNHKAFKVTTLKYQLYKQIMNIWAPKFKAVDYRPKSYEKSRYTQQTHSDSNNTTPTRKTPKQMHDRRQNRKYSNGTGQYTPNKTDKTKFQIETPKKYQRNENQRDGNQRQTYALQNQPQFYTLTAPYVMPQMQQQQQHYQMSTQPTYTAPIQQQGNHFFVNGIQMQRPPPQQEHQRQQQQIRDATLVNRTQN